MSFKNKLLDAFGFGERAQLLHKEDGVLHGESRQDAEPLIEWVKNRAQQPDDADYKYIGSIPQATLDQAMIEGWFHDAAAWRKWLADNPKFSAGYHK